MRAPSFFPPAWSLRLRVGTVLIGGLVTLAVLAPLVTAPPEAIADPRAAALLPPGSTRWAVTLTDGSTVIAEAVSSRDGAWEMVRRGQVEKVPYGTVTRVERHRHFRCAACGQPVNQGLPSHPLTAAFAVRADSFFA